MLVMSCLPKSVKMTEPPHKLRSPSEDDNIIQDDVETPDSTLGGISGSDRGYLADEDSSLYGSDDVVIIPYEGKRYIQDEDYNQTGVKKFFQSASSLSTSKKLIFGLFIVIAIATSWVGATQTAKSTYDGKFKAPFFLVWFSTSWMMLVYPITVPFYFILNWKLPTWNNMRALWSHSREVINPINSSPVTFLTSTVLFTLIWLPTNYFYSRALLTIPPTDVTALFSTAPAFVFIFSMIILREPPLILRFIAVIFAVCGIVLFAYEDGFGGADTVGVLLSVGSAIGAALYKTCLKWRVKEASVYQMGLFLSSLGLFSTVVFWPILILLHVTGKEVLVEIPWPYACGASILGIIFNFSINFGIAYTFPLFISLGTILGIPLNALVDVFVRRVDLANWKITAIDLIIGGFLLMLIPPETSYWIHKKLCCCGYKCDKGCHRIQT